MSSLFVIVVVAVVVVCQLLCCMWKNNKDDVTDVTNASINLSDVNRKEVEEVEEDENSDVTTDRLIHILQFSVAPYARHSIFVIL